MITSFIILNKTKEDRELKFSILFLIIQDLFLNGIAPGCYLLNHRNVGIVILHGYLISYTYEQQSFVACQRLLIKLSVAAVNINDRLSADDRKSYFPYDKPL